MERDPRAGALASALTCNGTRVGNVLGDQCSVDDPLGSAGMSTKS